MKLKSLLSLGMVVVFLFAVLLIQSAQANPKIVVLHGKHLYGNDATHKLQKGKSVTISVKAQTMDGKNVPIKFNKIKCVEDPNEGGDILSISINKVKKTFKLTAKKRSGIARVTVSCPDFLEDSFSINIP